jgi:hypothetical protein
MRWWWDSGVSSVFLSSRDVTPEVIALWLGHENLNSTHQYVEADLAMKERALKAVTPPKTKTHHFHPDDQLLRFLDSL